jgi:hypothetical protein
MIERDTFTLWAWACAMAVLSAAFTLAVQPLFERWGAAQKWWPQTLVLQCHICLSVEIPKETTPRFPNGADDELCLKHWATGIMCMMFHGTCGALMIPVAIYGWEASPFFQGRRAGVVFGGAGEDFVRRGGGEQFGSRGVECEVVVVVHV